MCARFGIELSAEEIALYFSLPRPTPELEPDPDVRPTNPIPMIVQQDGGRVLEAARWWLIPSWWKKSLKELPSAFNARSEDIEKKPFFRSAFADRHCLLIASYYFEWTGTKGNKVKHCIEKVDGSPIAFAGLWEDWTDPEGAVIRSCTMITTAANKAVESVHHRMPVILSPADFEEWLAPTARPAELLHLLQPCPNDWLRVQPA